MQDVRTLANQQRRRRLARHTVGYLATARATRRTCAAFADLNAQADQTSEAILDMVATVQMAEMWEQA